MRVLAETGNAVALILADRASNGAALLDDARKLHPHARRGLLLNWNESRSHREEIAAAFAHRQAECFVTKPSGSPDERFHRNITELLDEWWRTRGPRSTAVRIVCTERTARVYEMCDLLQRHDMPFAFHAADSDAGVEILELAGVEAGSLPSSSSKMVVRSLIPPTLSSPTPSVRALAPEPGSTTSSSSEAGPPDCRRRCMPSRRDCALRSSNRPPWVVRPERAR